MNADRIKLKVFAEEALIRVASGKLDYHKAIETLLELRKLYRSKQYSPRYDIENHMWDLNKYTKTKLLRSSNSQFYDRSGDNLQDHYWQIRGF